MISTVPDPEASAVRRAVRRFTHALEAEAMLAHTARLEARLHASGPGPVFLLDQALAAAWPGSAGAPPSREVIWASDAAGPDEGVRLCAFDAAGRVLLRLTYEVRPVPGDEPPVRRSPDV